MADDHARLATATLIIGRRKQTAQRWLNAKRIESVAAKIKHPSGAHLAAWGEIDGVRAPREDAGKGLLPVPYLFPNRIVNRRLPAEPAARSSHIQHPDFGKLLWRF